MQRGLQNWNNSPEGTLSMIECCQEIWKGGVESVILNTLSALVRLHEIKFANPYNRSSRDSRETARCESEIAPDILKRYQIMEERYGSTAVVPLKKGICTGCYLHQPGAGGKEIATQIYQCHYCGRLLYQLEDLYDETIY